MTAAATRVGVDVGGTFTDVVLHRADGSVAVRKLLSTPPSYDRAVIEAVSALAGDGEVSEVVHGTTVATNAVLERRGSRTALVTTAGFRDVLELRRLRIPHMYDLFWRKPPPLVERRLRFEVNERVTVDGTVLRPLDEAECRGVAARLRDLGVESVAVCFLHSYLYPAHEQRLGAILAEELPDASISLSSEILREQREYERSATTVVNAYVRPLMGSYVDRIRTGLDGIGLDGPLQIMQSSGGVMTSDDAKARPVFALESGPAAGVVAARGMAEQLGLRNVIAFDMGGTTAKASLIEDGAIARGREYEVGGSMSAGSRLIRGAGELLRIPTIDIAEVGAGGGSIAWLDPAGGLQVGPRSAGADPGPACYGRGGVEPTVTDANVLLGFMRAGTVADGQITISVEAAEAAVARVAGPLGLSVLEAASGIHRIANARMTRALRSVSSEKGRDPREFALVAYGGSGPMHAAGLADDLGVHHRPRPGGRGALQRGRPAVRAAGVPRGADVPPRPRRLRSRRGRGAPRRDGGAARTGARRPRGRVGAERRPALRRPELGGRDAARRGRGRHGGAGVAASALRGRARAAVRRARPARLARRDPRRPAGRARAGLRGRALRRRRRRCGARRDAHDARRRDAARGADPVACVDRRRSRAGPAARRRVRHDGGRAAGLDDSPRAANRDARALERGADG